MWFYVCRGFKITVSESFSVAFKSTCHIGYRHNILCGLLCVSNHMSIAWLDALSEEWLSCETFKTELLDIAVIRDFALQALPFMIYTFRCTTQVLKTVATDLFWNFMSILTDFYYFTKTNLLNTLKQELKLNKLEAACIVSTLLQRTCMHHHISVVCNH